MFHGRFGGDRPDDATRGTSDSLDVSGRLTVKPLAGLGWRWVDHLQVGLSAGYARIDATHVSLNVKTTGLTSFLDVTSMAKFNVIRDAQSRTRSGLELAWALGPATL